MSDVCNNTKLSLNKILCIFIILHILLWSILPLLREILPVDAMECIIWGGYADFGTNKHPPLAAWLSYFVYNFLGKSDFSIYLLGQIFIVIGFVYIYKLGKIFLGDVKALFAVMLLEACFVYTYMGIYEGFNPNFLLLAFLPFLSYYFWKCIHEDSLKNWIILGLGYGLAFIGKYQVIMLFLPMLLFLLITKSGRKQFEKKGLYISAIIALLCILPHIIWLFKHDFLSFNYFLVSESKYSDHYMGLLKYILAPLTFIFNQFITIIGILFIYFTANKISGKPIQFNKDVKSENSIFLLCVGILPLLLQTVPGLIKGDYLVPQWGYCLLFMTTILLFYFFPFELSKKVIKYLSLWVVLAAVVSSLILGYIYITERSFASRFPVKQVTNTLSEIYTKKTGKQIKYIGGFIELTIPLALYNDDYTVVLNTYKQKNPWIDTDDLRKTGALIIGRDPMFMQNYVAETTPYYKGKFSIKKFSFTVKNVLGKEKEYKMFYVIVPPDNVK